MTDNGRWMMEDRRWMMDNRLKGYVSRGLSYMLEVFNGLRAN